MRDFFINSLEKVVHLVVVLLGLAVLGAALAVTFGQGHMGPNGMGPNAMGGGGPLAGLLVLIGGGLYVIVVGGFLYMGIGIYQNTRRSAEALEKLATK